MNGWSTPTDIRARVRRRWDDGSLLRTYAAGEPFAGLEVPLRGPRPSEIGVDLGAAQGWVAALVAGQRDGTHYLLRFAAIGGRAIGRNELPVCARVTSYEQAWALLHVAREVARFDEILALAAAEPAVRAWVADHPLKALAVDDAWVSLLAAYGWLDDARGSGRFLREISAPTVDTKLVERNRPLLAALFGVPSTASGFLAALGLASKPETLRLRFGSGFAGIPPDLSEATFRLSELVRLRVTVQRAVIVENEITFLTMPIPEAGVVIWGKGFEVDRAGSLPWLRDAEVHYWGDLDTHGFAILDRLRAWLPQTSSLLMDRQTLLTHRDRWVKESSPTRARLSRLTIAEADLYADVVSDRMDERVRLEQERIDWAWAQKHFPYG